MPINTRGGKKTKKTKNKSSESSGKKTVDQIENELKKYNIIYFYGKVIRRLGGCPPILLVNCDDGKERKCIVRGKFIKKVWIKQDDIVLISCGDNISEGGEIYYKYNVQEISILESRNLLSNLKSKKNNDDSDDIIFTNVLDNEDIINNEKNNHDNVDIDLDDI